jgi:hypothetical protein
MPRASGWPAPAVRLGGRADLDAPQVLDDERQSGRIRPGKDFDFFGRAGAGGDPQDIVDAR